MKIWIIQLITFLVLLASAQFSFAKATYTILCDSTESPARLLIDEIDVNTSRPDDQSEQCDISDDDHCGKITGRYNLYAEIDAPNDMNTNGSNLRHHIGRFSEPERNSGGQLQDLEITEDYLFSFIIPANFRQQLRSGFEIRVNTETPGSERDVVVLNCKEQ